MTTLGDAFVEAAVADAERARVRLVELLERPVTELPPADVSARMTALHHALRLLRCEAARAMVDDDGLTTAEVGRRLGVSRQVCGRLVAEGRQQRRVAVDRSSGDGSSGGEDPTDQEPGRDGVD